MIYFKYLKFPIIAMIVGAALIALIIVAVDHSNLSYEVGMLIKVVVGLAIGYWTGKVVSIVEKK